MDYLKWAYFWVWVKFFLTVSSIYFYSIIFFRNHAVSSTSRPLSSNSSEDLLKEYGLDFSTLSFPRQQNFYQQPVMNTLPNPPMMFPQTTNNHNSTAMNNSNNFLDDLDPLKMTPKVGAQPPGPTNPVPPMAPPRTKKTVSQNWTTFD